MDRESLKLAMSAYDCSSVPRQPFEMRKRETSRNLRKTTLSSASE